MLSKSIVVILILGHLSVMTVRAQQDTCRQRTIPVSINTKDGSPVPPLESSNLQGIDRKKPIHVTSITANQEPPRVVLLLDTSGSMGGISSAFERSFSVELAKGLALNMPSASEIGLGFFYTEFVPVLRPTTDRKALDYQLEGLLAHPKSYKGRTALWDAILDGVKMFDHPHVGDAIYVITDGDDNASRNNMKHVAQSLAEVGIRLFAFAFQNSMTTIHGTELDTGPLILEEVADDTGGTIAAQMADIPGYPLLAHDTVLFDKSGKPTILGSSLESQFREMAAFYRVNIDLPRSVDKPREWKLDFVGFSESQRHKLILTYPRMLMPCH